jgi:hypothetical protein
MTQPQSLPVHSVLQGNADSGDGPLLPHNVFAVATSLAGLEDSVMRPVYRAPKHPNTALCHRIPHLREPAKPATPTRSGSDRGAALYNPHNLLWGAV